MRSVELLIIGAGPFGLSMAAQAQQSGIDYLVVGKPMDFWRSHMPAGMLLRSACDWHLDPADIHTIEAFLSTRNQTPADVEPLSLDFYLDYTRWFQEQKRLLIDPLLVERLDRVDGIFQAQMENGETIAAANVVLALGFGNFAHIPAELAALLPAGRYAHSRDLVDFASLADKRVLIIGGRQSAFESAALLREAGAAHVHICYRHPTPRFEPSDWGRANRIVAGLAENPTWFRDLSDAEKDDINHWFWTEGRLKLEPWLWPRLSHPNVTLWPETELAGCGEQADGSLAIRLESGAEFVADQALFATGYEVEMGRVPLLAQGNLLGELATANGYPRLDEHLQTNIPGLFVTSIAAVQDFGLFFGFTISARLSAPLMGRGIQQRLTKPLMNTDSKEKISVHQRLNFHPITTRDHHTRSPHEDKSMKLAKQLDKLGTETAFAVSAAAAAWAAKGHKVYPLHLGDINLPTPPNIVEATKKAIANGHTGYCAGAGIAPLRAILAEDVGSKRGVQYSAENVSVQPGGKPVIGKFISAVMNPGDEVLYPNPGYPIYESQIEYQGGVAVPYGYNETPTGFALDLEGLRASITPRTKAILYNNYQNPLGAQSTRQEMETVAELAIANDLWVLSDDAYHEMRYGGEALSIVNLPGMQERTVILYTCSKRFAMTGWRLGAAIGPKEVIEVFNKLNTNAESCTTHFIQHAMVEAIPGDSSGPDAIVEILRARRDAAVAGLNAIDGISIAAPESTFYLFPNVSKVMERKGLTDINDLMRGALEQTDVSFCTRNHFGRPLPGKENNFIRLAYSGISVEEIQVGLQRLKGYFEAA